MQVQLDRMTMPQFEEGRSRTRTVVIPFGSLEQHGPHLPLGTDTLQVKEICLRAAEQTGAFVAPEIPYGVCRSTRDHPGTVGLSVSTLRALVLELGREFYRHGLRNLVLISGHAGKSHLVTLVEAGESLLAQLPDSRVAVISEYREIQERGGTLIETENDAHAGEIETSRIMFLFPELVRGKAGAEYPNLPSSLLVRDKRRYWPGGVWGDPTRATLEKGRELTAIAVRRVAELIRELESQKD